MYAGGKIHFNPVEGGTAKMDNRFKYHRSFLIFTHEDSRNGEGREPSGYVK